MKISNITAFLIIGLMVVFSGCSDDADNTVDTPTYSANVTNLTVGQPMSPVLVSSYSIFSVGESASAALELQAEGGDNSELLDSYSVSGAGLLSPGASESISFESSLKVMSLTTMLVKTNDAFAGIDSFDISDLAIGSSKTVYLNVYDAGTEANTETNTTVAAFAVEGFNATRDDSNIITLHPGIISNEDGLSTSALSATEKWNNPALSVTITRTK